jgi:predicted DNA-binding transcriptional regulator YafY
MRASRLLSIQMLLETRGRMSATALAEALEVSVRTLHRDVDELSAAGVPVYAERGRNGGYALLPGWKTTLTGLTPSEAEAVFLSGLAGPAADLGLAPQARSARLKVMASLPEQWRGNAERIASRFHLDPIDWYREPDAMPHLALVATAVWEQRQLAIAYESWKTDAGAVDSRLRGNDGGGPGQDGAKLRIVHPLGLVLKAGVWYLVAAREGQPRTYRVSNILRAELQEAKAVRPRRFDLPAYWRTSVQRFEQEIYTGEAQVAATAEGLRQLRRIGAAHARAVAGATTGRGKDGRSRLHVPIESVAHATGQLLRLAPEVEVLGPPVLREAMRRKVAEAAALYRR